MIRHKAGLAFTQERIAFHGMTWCYAAYTRVLRMTRHYEVLPSLEVTSSLVPSYGNLQRSLLRLDLDNSQVYPHHYFTRVGPSL